MPHPPVYAVRFIELPYSMVYACSAKRANSSPTGNRIRTHLAIGENRSSLAGISVAPFDAIRFMSRGRQLKCNVILPLFCTLIMSNQVSTYTHTHTLSLSLSPSRPLYLSLSPSPLVLPLALQLSRPPSLSRSPALSHHLYTSLHQW